MADEEFEYEEATPEQKLAIATHFIQRSPHGELHDVIRDLNKLLQDPSILSSDNIESILREYNTDNFWFSKNVDGGMSVVSNVGQVDSTHYRDPETKQVFEFDHDKQSVVSAVDDTESTLSDEVAQYRHSISSAIQKYSGDMFARGKYATAVYADDASIITIIITAKNLNLSNFWSGGWRSQYTVNVSSTGSTSLDGTIQLKSHYFEDGNVQLNSKFNKSHDVIIDQDADQTGKAIAAAVETIESEFQSKLDVFYINMKTNTFKAMRRMLPVTKQKMDWRSEAHKLAGEVSTS